MPKITFMGAGSTVFARNVLGDCMCTPALRESEIALYDIDQKRLTESEIILSAINKTPIKEKPSLKPILAQKTEKKLCGELILWSMPFRLADMTPAPLPILKFQKNMV